MAEDGAAGSVPAASPPVLQIHTTRRCNLACAHCYSWSGPREREALDPNLISGLFEDAVREGYRIANFSGGEPFVDRNIFRHFTAARASGLGVQVVSNGTLIDARFAARVAESVDQIAISIDGPPEIHDGLRRSRGSFERAVSGLRALRAAGARIAIIHTVRVESLPHLRWLRRFARDEGAGALQLHPIENSGRATSALAQEFGHADLPTRLAMLTTILAADGEGPPIHVDVARACAHRDGILGARGDGPLASNIDPLVIEPDGAIVPWTYGMDRTFQIGQLNEERLAAAADRFRGTGLDQALRHHKTVGENLALHHPWPYVAWHAHLARAKVNSTV